MQRHAAETQNRAVLAGVALVCPEIVHIDTAGAMLSATST